MGIKQMADKEKLRDMLDAIIDDNTEKAEVDLHEYLGGKMRDAISPESLSERMDADSIHTFATELKKLIKNKLQYADMLKIIQQYGDGADEDDVEEMYLDIEDISTNDKEAKKILKLLQKFI